MPYLVSSFTPGRKWIAMPGADVLVFYTDSVARVAELAKPHEVDRGRWRLRSGVLASFEGSSHGDDETAAADTRDGTLSLAPSDAGAARFVLDGAGSVASAALDPALIASIPGRLADAFARSPFVPLADPVRAMTLQVRGRTLRLRLEVPAAKLIEAGQIAWRDHGAVRELWRNLRRAVGAARP